MKTGYSRHIERNDCVVRALANSAHLTYEQAYAECRAEGRRPGCGMRLSKWLPLFKGWLDLEDYRSLAHVYPTATTLTRHLSRRGGVWLVLFTRHVAVFRDGEWQDWMSGNRRHRVKAVWRIVE